MDSKLSLLNYCKACSRSCCYIGPVLLLPEEYKKIVERTGRKDVFKPHDGFYILEKKANEPCPFLDMDNGRCIIQDFKPIDCKVWPLYFGKNGSVQEISISSDCPAHKFLEKIYIEYARAELSKIPEALRKHFYKITLEAGYQLRGFKE